MEDAILECTGSDLEVVSRQQAGELTQTLQANWALDHKRALGTGTTTRLETLRGRVLCRATHLVLATGS